MSCVYYDGLVNLQSYLNQTGLDGKEFTLTLTNATWETVTWTSSKSMKAKKNLKKLSL